MIVVSGPASYELGLRIAERLGVEAYPVDHRLFPDGESYIRLTQRVDDEAVVIVQTTFPDPDKSLLQLILMIDATKSMGASEAICVVPYLAYARQDKRFLDGEALSLDTIMKFLDSTGADELVVVDVHDDDSLKTLSEERDMAVTNLSSIPLLAKHLKERGFEGAYSLSPDEGAIHLAKLAEKVLEGGSGFFVKRRDRTTGEIEMVVKDLDLEGRDAVVFDDIVSSGGTTARAVVGLKNQGARRVAAACAHGLFMGNAWARIKDAGAEIILSTDTVESPMSGVSVSGLLAEHLKKR